MPIPRRLFLSVFLAALLVPALLAAQPPVWQPLGPYGGVVLGLTTDPVQPGVLYATAGHSGVFKSTDRGASWRNVLVADAHGRVAVDPSRPSVLYAIAYPGVVRKSNDGGASWRPIGRGLPAGPGLIRSVTVDPARRNRVYLATNTGVWRSLDGGGTWQRASTGMLGSTPPPITAFLAVRSPAGTAFAGTGNGLYRTTDGGGSWTRLGQGLPTVTVAALAASEADPQTVYVLFHAGLYKTVNGGRSWRPVVGPPAGLTLVTSLVAAPRSSSILYATLSNGDVLRSSDGARSWSRIGKLPGTQPVDLTPDPFAARVLYAGLSLQTSNPFPGVFRSDDGGATWQRRSQGYTGNRTLTVSVAPHEPEQVWTAAGHQVFRSGNGGRRWARAAAAPGRPFLTTTTQLATASGSTAFALTVSFSPFEIALWRTEDAGASWQAVSPPAGPATVVFRVAPSEVSTLYTLEQSGAGGADVSRTTNGGDSWETRATDLDLDCRLGDLAVAPATASVLYVTGAGPVPSTFCLNPAARVLRSRDGGTTWTDVSAGLPPGVILHASVDPGDPDVLYVGYGPYPPNPGDGVWKSTDGGAIWRRAGTEIAGRAVTALLATAAPGRVYAVVGDAQVFRSEDGGESWEDVSAGLRTLRVLALAADPFDPDRVYAATANGVWLLEEE